MTYTHITHRLARFVAKHGAMLEVLAMSAALAGIILTEEIRYEAHFLQRATESRQEEPAPVRVRTPRDAPAIAAADRVAMRRAQRLISRLTIVADASRRPFPVARETLRAAAPADAPENAAFPAFGQAVHPVAQVPDWGAMTVPAEWNRHYGQMDADDFVQPPAYDLSMLTIPLRSLLTNRHDPGVIRSLTAKLYYSTRYFGAYDLDADEFSAVHPGIDLKLAEDTPVGAVAGGRVHDVRTDARTLGLHVILEHRAPDGETYYSVYGHLGSASVRTGASVAAGQTVGLVGMTGNTTGPHLHLQIDRGEPDETHHEIYWPAALPSRSAVELHTINPMEFIRQYGNR